ncbi:MAG: class I mannose-6-phosphate isomerase [Bacteroidales bacterium]|jgi:mannose-6-phosphate isomerase|nr:class I mannose-6-phosphate isomerase [Bacteroidales bacterium]
MLYPLKFKPVYKDKIWGGQKIRTHLGLDFSPLPNCGELWALSGVSGCQTEIVNGFLAGNELNEILEIYMDELVGEKVFEKHQTEFPLLIKVIDANAYLSIQVHPDDKLAALRKIGSGKTEMWYILEAESGAELITGFNREMNASTYLDFFHQKRLKEILNVEKVKRDDLFFIPAGRVHALGPGILLAEIQQTSDTTYRIFDWDRVDSEGNPRDLHTDLALEAIDFNFPDSYRTHYRPIMNQSSPLVDCPYFTTDLLTFDRKMEKDYSILDSFVIYLGIEGKAIIRTDNDPVSIKPGEAILLPATIENTILEPDSTCKLLEVYIS